MLKSKAFRKLAFVGVLVSTMALPGESKPVQACEILPCPEFWSWMGCQRGCACVTTECCRFYGGGADCQERD